VLLGHERLETTMIYTHVARKGVAAVTSPLELLDDLTVRQIGAVVDATGRLNRGWMACAEQYDHFDRIQRVFNQRESTPALTPTTARNARSSICSGSIDRLDFF
jgi:hypothetical protein